MPKCYSVKLENLTSISEKCYLARSFDGREALIPKSQVIKQDFDVRKSDAYWITEWILKQKDIQYSTKKEAYFDDKGNMTITYKKIHHIPKAVNKEVEYDKNLLK